MLFSDLHPVHPLSNPRGIDRWIQVDADPARATLEASAKRLEDAWPGRYDMRIELRDEDAFKGPCGFRLMVRHRGD